VTERTTTGSWKAEVERTEAGKMRVGRPRFGRLEFVSTGLTR
jgi:hypothetical protein